MSQFFDTINKGKVIQNILGIVGQDSTFEQLSKSMEPEELEKAMGHKYFKREGTPGNYKYYYTEAEYRAAKGKKSEDQSSEVIEKDGKKYKLQPNGKYLEISEQGMTKEQHIIQREKDREAAVDVEGRLRKQREQSSIKNNESASKLSDKEFTKEGLEGLDINVGQKYHTPAPEGGEAIDFVVKKIDNGKYTIETTNEEGRKGEHTFDEKTIKELISESKLKEPGKEFPKIKHVSDYKKLENEKEVNKIIGEFFDEKNELSRSLKNMPINSLTEQILNKVHERVKEKGYLTEQGVYSILSDEERRYLKKYSK